MSRVSQPPRRYARVLLDVAEQAGEVETLRADLAQVRRWLEQAPAFHVFAAIRRLGGREARLQAVRTLAATAGLGRVTSEFLMRVEEARDLDRLASILDEFERLRQERAGIQRAEIVSARPLTETQQAELVRRLGKGRTLATTWRQDPGLIGGWVARVGEKIYDASVSGRLARLRRRFSEA